MAEDDDDDTFGDFSFASSSIPQNDDDWGDFLQSQQQSKPSDSIVSAPRFVKPSGALPLSIFGDFEEEQGGGDAVVKSSGGGDSVLSGNGIGDLDLSSIQMSESSIVLDPVKMSGSCPNLRTLASLTFDMSGGSGKRESSNGGDVANGVVGDEDDDDDDDDDGWEFKDAFSESSNAWNVNNEVGFMVHQVVDSSSNKKSVNSILLDPNPDSALSGGRTLEFNGSYPNSKALSSLNLDINGQKRESNGDVSNAMDDDDGWEFKDAFSESSTAWNVNNEVDFMVHQVSERSAYSSGGLSGSNELQDLFGTSNGPINLFSASNESASFFATSNGPSSSSREVGFTNILPTATPLNGSIPDTSIKVEQNIRNGTVDPSPDAGSTETDEDFGDFTAAPAESVSTQGEKNTELNYSGNALPLSIFGIEEQKLDVSLDLQDPFVHHSTSDTRHSHAPTSVISVDDLISSLYSHSEQPSAISIVQKSTEMELNLSNEVSSFNVVIEDDYIDDNSWDFKDAFSQTGLHNEESLDSIADLHRSISPKLKLDGYLDFYSKLKEELFLVAKFHKESLKQSRSSAAASGEDTKVDAIDSELQELEQINSHLEGQDSQNQPARGHNLNLFLKLLLEPQFQILESEYQLSQKLLLVEKDLRAAMELLRHTNTMLKILAVGTSEERSAYISVWSDMISVCAQELKHGVWLWNQAVEKKVQTHLLSEPQGCNFVLALGEIYRVAVILGASAKVFKPWTFSVDSSGMYILIQECHTLWSASGLEEALANVSAPIASDAASLLNSIEYIRSLDALALQNYVSTEKESLCWLSILTASVAPGLKMITWGNKQCFVTLANLWANLISCNPPMLPPLNIG